MTNAFGRALGWWGHLYGSTADDYKGWQVVLAVVLLALGATILLGALVFCMAQGQNLGFIVNLGAGKVGVMCVPR